MIKPKDVISRVKVYGLKDSVRASKYPMAADVGECTSEITERTRKLGSAEKGSGHDNFLNGIVVQFDLTFTIKAWIEGERYHFLDFVSSQSTMHRLHKFKLAKQCIKYTDAVIVQRAQELIDAYNAEPSRENYLHMIYSVPVGLRLTARMTTNYRQIKTILSQRKTHRLPEWTAFCEWIEGLPYFKELCLDGEQVCM